MKKTLKYVIKVYNFYILISNNIDSNFCNIALEQIRSWK